MIFLSICLIILQFSYIHLQQAQDEEGMGLNDGKVAFRVMTRMTWQDAHRYCEARNSRLITHFMLGHTFLHKILFQNLTASDAYWAGFKRASSNVEFDWVRGYELSEIGLYPTLNGTASNIAHCGVVSYSNGNVVYHSKACTETRPFICEKYSEICSDPLRRGFGEAPNRVFYFKVDTKASFSDAYKYCAVFNAHLPSITNEAENDYITGLARTTVRSTQAYWLGSHRLADGDWQWFDSAPTCYSKNFVDYIAPTASEVNNRRVMWSNQARVLDTNKVQGTWGHQDATGSQGIICQKRCGFVPSSCKSYF